MGRRPYSTHGDQAVNPDSYYNENENYGIIDSRDEKRILGIGAGKGSFGTPAGSLISGYTGPTVKKEQFPYSSGMGQLKRAEKAWQPTGISLGLETSAAQAKFARMLPSLKATDPSMDFKMGPGAAIPTAKVQRRIMGLAWHTVVEIPNSTDDAVRTAADDYKRKHPDATLRIVKDKARDYTVFKRFR
jgi:hypothetical protein